ncbi:DUF6624 domain-containing protein [Phenylobacterium sp. CCH9-H3]|uniref:DUF6624 domain-containing protein n=1 Tax=Phenylobacterium sp. CCH9-H3 TaxID=1768774 RepID=UPI00350FE931
MAFGIVVALSIAASASADTPDSAGKGEAAAQAALARVRALQDAQSRLPPPANLAEELQRRVDVDQAVRDWSWQAGLAVGDQRAAVQVIAPAMAQIDMENTAWLKTQLPADGWFRISRDGPSVANNAFLIVQHSPDAAWRKEIVARMEPLAMAGEVSPASFALMYDRVMLAETGRQRYGTQAICRDGAVAIAEMEEPEKVQARRDAIKFTQPLHEAYRKGLEGRKC